MYHYIQIDDDGYVVSDSWLSDEVTSDNMIRIEGSFDPTGKKFDRETNEFVPYTPEPVEPVEPQISAEEETQLNILANTEYLIALAELGF